MATLSLSPSNRTKVARGQRFTISAPVSFRKVGESEWATGTIENVGESGILFRTARTLAPKTPVEMRFVPTEERILGGGLAAEVRCWGSVVRVVGSPAGGVTSLLGATIARYRLVRRSAASGYHEV